MGESMLKKVYEHFGWLEIETAEEEHETITLEGEPIAEALSYIS